MPLLLILIFIAYHFWCGSQEKEIGHVIFENKNTEWTITKTQKDDIFYLKAHYKKGDIQGELHLLATPNEPMSIGWDGENVTIFQKKGKTIVHPIDDGTAFEITLGGTTLTVKNLN